MERIQPLRQLPCRVHLSCGSCSYGDSCVFLHDTRLNCPVDFVPMAYVPRGRGKCSTTDGLYWPTMSMKDVMILQDSRGFPDINQVSFTVLTKIQGLFFIKFAQQSVLPEPILSFPHLKALSSAAGNVLRWHRRPSSSQLRLRQIQAGMFAFTHRLLLVQSIRHPSN